jgi:zeaxanthin glucosyltransferase
LSTALFLIYPAAGHLNASFAVARALGRQQVQPLYASHEADALALAHRQGFKTRELKNPPFGLGYERFLRAKGDGAYDYWDEMLLRAANQLYLSRKAELDAIMTTIRPKVVFMDTHCPTDFVILYRYWAAQAIQIIFLSTQIPDQVDSDYPPSYLLAYPGPENKDQISRAWRAYKFHSRAGALRTWFKFLGRSDGVIRSRNFRLNNIPLAHRLNKQRSNGLVYENVPEWILAPASLLFPGQPILPTQCYLGLCVDHARREDQARDIAQLVEKLRKQGSVRVIYVSFGTRYQHYGEVILGFLQKLASLLLIHADWHLFMVLDQEFWPRFVPYPNLHLSASWPQLAMLSKADLFITHAGLNSVKEALHFGVPMLCYPIESFGDQKGNAARVQYYGLGLLGLLALDTASDIEAKIIDLLTNDSYQQALAKFGKGGQEILDEVITKIL